MFFPFSFFKTNGSKFIPQIILFIYLVKKFVSPLAARVPDEVIGKTRGRKNSCDLRLSIANGIVSIFHSVSHFVAGKIYEMSCVPIFRYDYFRLESKDFEMFREQRY